MLGISVVGDAYSLVFSQNGANLIVTTNVIEFNFLINGI